MYMFIKTFFVILVIVGCAGVSDVYKKLTNGYIYVSESEKQKYITKNPLQVNSKLYIPCEVLEYKFNKRYIIAKIRFYYKSEYPVGFNENRQLKRGEIYYYIIDTINNKRYGAFDNFEQFNHMLKRLHIELVID